jgi:hypothetical protein
VIGVVPLRPNSSGNPRGQRSPALHEGAAYSGAEGEGRPPAGENRHGGVKPRFFYFRL